MAGRGGTTDSLVHAMAEQRASRSPVTSPKSQFPPQSTATKSQFPVQLCGNCEANPATVHCDECGCLFCDNCAEAAHSMRFTQQHVLQPIASSGCIVHGQPISVWCVQCRVAVCQQCAMADHSSHQQQPVKQAVDAWADDLDGLLHTSNSSAQALDRVFDRFNGTPVPSRHRYCCICSATAAFALLLLRLLCLCRSATAG